MRRRSFSLRLLRSACFCRLTGVSVPTFEGMVAQLRAPWEAAERRKAKSGRPREVGGLSSCSVSTIWTRNGERSGAHTWKDLSYFLMGERVSFQTCHISVLPKKPIVSTAAIRSPLYPASIIPTELARRILVLLMLDLG